MPSNPSTYTARLPRHPVVDSAALEVSVFTDDQQAALPVEMLDFSRQGMRFHSRATLANAAPIRVRLRLGTEGPLEWTFPGHIRWFQAGASGLHSYGCEFTEMVTWEQLGELLLHGVLSPE